MSNTPATDAAPAPVPLLLRVRRVLVAGVMGGVCATALGLLVHELRTGAAWSIQTVEISGNVVASKAAIRHLADLRTGTPLLTADLGRVVRGVNQHPWVRKAEARRIFPSTVQIVVEEHDTALLLALDSLWTVDSAGVVFARARSDDLDHPVLTGLDAALVGAHPEVARVALRDALAILRAGEGHPLADPRQVSELRLNRRAGFTVVLRDGSELFFGFGSPEERLDRLDRLVAAGLRLDEGPLRIDLDDPELALVRPMVDPPTAAELAAAEAEALALANPGALPADAPPSPIPAAPH